MFELLTSSTSQGTLAEVWIDKSANQCRKYYKPAAVTASGKKTTYIDFEQITHFFEQEVYWSSNIVSEYTIETYDAGQLTDGPGYFILQEYIGPDLLTHYIAGTLFEEYPTIIDQIEEMFILFKKHNVYKKNNSLSNMSGRDGKIKAFDFKYTSLRDISGWHDEHHSITTWLSKIDPDIKNRLIQYL